MTEPEAPELTIEKLVGVYRVLIPHKIAAYTFHLNNTSTITDAPTIRSLEVRVPGRVRRLARRRDADPVAHRDRRRGRSGRGAPGQAREAARGRRWHRRSWHDSGGTATRSAEVSAMKKFFPVEELARDSRFVRVDMRRPHARPAPPAATAANRAARATQRLSPELPRRSRRGPRPDARHLRRRDPGARRGRPHLLGLRGRHDRRRRPLRPQARHGPPVLGRGPPLRDLREAERLDGHRDRRVLRVRRSSTRRPATPIPCCGSRASTGRSRAWPSTCSTR